MLNNIDNNKYDLVKKPVFWTPLFIYVKGWIKPTTDQEVAEWVEKNPTGNWRYYAHGLVPDNKKWENQIRDFLELNEALVQLELHSLKLSEADLKNEAKIANIKKNMKTKQLLVPIIGKGADRMYYKDDFYDDTYIVSANQKFNAVVPKVYDIDGNEISHESVKAGDLVRLQLKAFVSKTYGTATTALYAIQRFKHVMDLPVGSSVSYDPNIASSDAKLIEELGDDSTFDTEDIPF